MTHPDDLTQEHARELIRQLPHTHQTVLFQLAKASTASSTEAQKASTLANKIAITVRTFYCYCSDIYKLFDIVAQKNREQ